MTIRFSIRDRRSADGGNFYGGHIAFAMDGLKAALASVADMCDRQIMLLVSPSLNRGLPGDLVRKSSKEKGLRHGLRPCPFPLRR